MRGRVGRRGADSSLDGGAADAHSVALALRFLQKYYLDNIGTAKVQIMKHLYIA